jgi:hypothetical protein
VTGLLAPDGEAGLAEATLARQAGCCLLGEQRRRELCPVSGANLSSPAASERLHDLLAVTALRAEEVEPGEEPEERHFDVATWLGIGDGDLERSTAAAWRSGTDTLLHLRCVPEARVVRVHRGWRGAPQEGFSLGLPGGDWHADTARDGPATRRVRPWTWHRADALHLQPGPALRLGHDGATALLQALQQAIERRLRLAPGALAAATVGEGDAPGLLLYAADGSLDGLSRLVTEPDAFTAVAAQALATCPADTPAVRDALARLAAGALEPPGGTHFTTYEILCEQLLHQPGPEPSAAQRFIDFLQAHDLRLPDAARRRVPGLYVQPDFHYAPHTWVFCDGESALSEGDSAQRDALWARGDEVFTWHAGEDLAAKVAERPDLFGPAR